MFLHVEILVQFSFFVLETNITSSGYDSALHISQNEWEATPFFPYSLTSISMTKYRLLHIKK